MEEERSRLYKIDSIEVLDYIKQSVEILMNMKGEEYDQYIKNRDLHERMQLKEEKKRLKEMIKGEPKKKEKVDRYLTIQGLLNHPYFMSINDAEIAVIIDDFERFSQNY